MFFKDTLLSQELHKMTALLIFMFLFSIAINLAIKIKKNSLRDQKLKFNNEVSIPAVFKAVYVMVVGWYGYAVGEWMPVYLIFGAVLLGVIWLLLKELPEALWKQGSENNKGELLISVPFIVFFLLLIAYVLGRYEG